ncbi:MAG: PEP-CTERM sorting domain-containing protein [Cyanobacteria bacterium J06554_6]
MSRLTKLTAAGIALAAGLAVVQPAAATTFTADYSGSLDGSITLDATAASLLPLLGFDIPATVDFSATAAGSYSLDPDRFLDGDLTLELASVSAIAPIQTAYFDSLLAGLGLGSTSAVVAQLDDVFDYSLTGIGTLSDGTGDDEFTIDYLSSSNELVVAGFDATGCLSNVCSITSMANLSLSLNVAAFGTFVDTLAALDLPDEVQETVAEVQNALIFAQAVLPSTIGLATGEVSGSLVITPIEVTDAGGPDDYAISLESGEILVAAAGETLFQETVTEPLAYSTYPSAVSYGGAASTDAVSETDTSSGSESGESWGNGTDAETTSAGSTTETEVQGGNGTAWNAGVSEIIEDNGASQSVPEPGVVMGLLSAAGLAWRRRVREG